MKTALHDNLTSGKRIQTEGGKCIIGYIFCVLWLAFAMNKAVSLVSPGLSGSRSDLYVIQGEKAWKCIITVH